MRRSAIQFIPVSTAWTALHHFIECTPILVGLVHFVHRTSTFLTFYSFVFMVELLAPLIESIKFELTTFPSCCLLEEAALGPLNLHSLISRHRVILLLWWYTCDPRARPVGHRTHPWLLQGRMPCRLRSLIQIRVLQTVWISGFSWLVCQKLGMSPQLVWLMVHHIRLALLPSECFWLIFCGLWTPSLVSSGFQISLTLADVGWEKEISLALRVHLSRELRDSVLVRSRRSRSRPANPTLLLLWIERASAISILNRVRSHQSRHLLLVPECLICHLWNSQDL